MLAGIFAAPVVLYGVAVAGLYLAMRQPPETFGAIMARLPQPVVRLLPFRPLWMSAREGPLQIGDAAPDFVLPALDAGRSVRLSDEVRERPVCLIFGSYT